MASTFILVPYIAPICHRFVEDIDYDLLRNGIDQFLLNVIEGLICFEVTEKGEGFVEIESSILSVYV